MIHKSVLEAFHSYSEPLEGRVHSMYCDILGLVTCGVGNLIDPIWHAEQLPWTLEDGSPADKAQVRADWHKLKDGAVYYSKRHWRFARDATKVRLTDAAIDALVEMRLQSNAKIICKRFPNFPEFPADAQLAILSIAWAVGAGFYHKFPTLARAIDIPYWLGAEASCTIREKGNPGVIPRNKANRLLFRNAEIVRNSRGDVSVLHWPDIAGVTQGVSASTLQQDAQAAQQLGDFVGTPGANLSEFERDDK